MYFQSALDGDELTQRCGGGMIHQPELQRAYPSSQQCYKALQNNKTDKLPELLYSHSENCPGRGDIQIQTTTQILEEIEQLK